MQSTNTYSFISLGIPLTTEAGEKIGVSSTTAAVQGISMVTISRIAMASPGMLLLPVFMDKLEKRGVLARFVIFLHKPNLLLYFSCSNVRKKIT